MLLSIALILLIGLLLGSVCEKLKLPRLIGMILTGIILGPYVLSLIDDSILNISAELRKIALIIILTRAGLTLDINDLKRVGRPAMFMCFVPACFEIIGMIIFAPLLFGVSYIEAALMGAVVAAVSPAVIVPKMIKLIEEGKGTKKSIPQLILAGASVDDIFVIVLFSAFLSLVEGQGVSTMSLVNIPLSIVFGMIIGVGVGYLLNIMFKRYHLRDSIKVMIILSLSFLLVSLEDSLTTMITFSALISVMFIGITMKKQYEDVAIRLSSKFNKLWVCAEIILFVLVGATIDLQFAFQSGINAIVLILIVLLFRVFGVYISLLKTDLNTKERVFCMMAYIPKATVQAAIGGIPLTLGLACGPLVLTLAVIAIVITAPLGAFLIDRYQGWLTS